jgi:hypothetical protein
MTRLFSLAMLTLAAVCMGMVTSAPAQTLDAVSPQTYEPPAHVAFVDGVAMLERDGALDSEPRNMPLVAGDRLRTQNGRVEVLFADGATLHLDANTLVDFQSDELLRLLEGRIRLSIPGPDRGDVFYRVDAAAGWAQITAPGEYRLSLSGDSRAPELELAVIRGQAELATEGGQTPLRAGERAFARVGAAPSYAYVFNSAAWDAFDQWSHARRSQSATVSVQHLPSEVRRYAPAFDQYGTWGHHATYGHVWYPTVAVDWRPYHYGRWVTLPVYGWTWIGRDPWAWPTHHYGRWGVSGGVWYWIPGRTWAPAWVAWAYAPGYVSWSPLGWDNRPLIQINIFSSRTRWHPWTVVPYRYFGVGPVHVRAVHIWNLDAGVRRSFAYRHTAPAYTARPRASAPIRTAGTRVGTAVPRGSVTGTSPSYTNRGPGNTRTQEITGPNGRVAPGSRTAPGSRVAPERMQPSVPATRAAERPTAVPRGGVQAGSDRAVRPQGDRGPQAGTRAAPPSGAAPTARTDVGPGSRPAPRAEPTAPATRAPIRRDAAPAGQPVPRAEPRGGERTPARVEPRGGEQPAAPPATRAVPRGGERTPARVEPRGGEQPAASAGTRAVPRTGAPQTAPPSGERAAPRAVPRGGERTPARVEPRGGERPALAPAPAGTARPQAAPSRAPSRSIGAPDRRAPQAPAASPAPRAVPRSGPPSGQRAAPAPSRQSAPPPAAAPSSGGGESNRGSATPGSRPRGGEPSRGGATRRGGE